MSLAENASAAPSPREWTERVISRGYVRVVGQEFSEDRATTAEVRLHTEPGPVALSIGVVSERVDAVRIDFADRPITFRLHSLRVVSGKRSLYAWNGDPATFVRSADLEIRPGVGQTAIVTCRAPTAALLIEFPPVRVNGEVTIHYEAALAPPESALAEALAELRTGDEGATEDVVQDLLTRLKRARSEVERALSFGRRSVEEVAYELAPKASGEDGAERRALEARLDAGLRRIGHGEDVVLALIATAEQHLAEGGQSMRDLRRMQFDRLIEVVERLGEDLPERFQSSAESLRSILGREVAEIAAATQAAVSTQQGWTENARLVLSRLESGQGVFETRLAALGELLESGLSAAGAREAAIGLAVEARLNAIEQRLDAGLNAVAEAAAAREQATEQVLAGRLSTVGGRLEAGLGGVEQLMRAQALQLQAEQQDWLALQLPRAVEAVVGRVTAEIQALEVRHPALPSRTPEPKPAAPERSEREHELERLVQELEQRLADQARELDELRLEGGPGHDRSPSRLAGRRS